MFEREALGPGCFLSPRSKGIDVMIIVGILLSGKVCVCVCNYCVFFLVFFSLYTYGRDGLGVCVCV